MVNLDHLSKEELALALFQATAQLNELKMWFVKPENIVGTIGGVHRSHKALLFELLDSVEKIEYKEACLEIFNSYRGDKDA